MSTKELWEEIEIPGPLFHSTGVTCGYVAILNCLVLSLGSLENVKLKDASSTDLVEHLLETYGKKTSRDYGNGTRHRSDGLTTIDLCDVFNEIRSDLGLEPVFGMDLERLEKETQPEHLCRLHAKFVSSIKNGTAPLIKINVQSVRPCVTEKFELDFYWHCLAGHYVSVVGITNPPCHDGSFLLNCVDPVDGNQKTLFVHSEIRDFTAPKGNRESAIWLVNRPFAAIESSWIDMGLSDALWNLRTICYMDFAVI